MHNVVVTGGTRGIGFGITKRLIKDGFRVTVLARRETPELAQLRETASAAAGTDDGGPVQFVSCDLLGLNELRDVIKAVRAIGGPIHALVNNAGGSVEGLHMRTSVQQIETLVRLNTTAPLVLTQCVLRSMVADGIQGSIVNMSSIVASTGYSGLATYSATKASLVGFTRSLAREVGRLGIRVNAVAPGFVNTGLTGSMTEEQRSKIERRNALKEWVGVEAVADAVAFLLSDRARSITGTVLTVDAGNTA